MQHVEIDNLGKESQHRLRSCLSNVLEFSQHISKLVGRREVVDIIYLDLKNSFGAAPRKRLIYKVSKHGKGREQ